MSAVQVLLFESDTVPFVLSLKMCAIKTSKVAPVVSIAAVVTLLLVVDPAPVLETKAIAIYLPDRLRRLLTARSDAVERF